MQEVKACIGLAVPGRPIGPWPGRETAMTTIAHPEPSRVTVGVDTHGEVHVACALDQLGRQLATRRGKSDPVDAEAAARAVLAGQATAIPKTGSHLVEMVRCVRVARATAVKARTQAANALRALVVTAPAELRERLRGLPTGRLASTAARLCPGPLLTVTAATNERLRSEAAFSMLCGASPIPASSGKTVRHRLNRGWQPPGQHRPVPDRDRSAALAPANPRLHGPANQRGLVEAGDHPVLEALRGRRGLRSHERTHRPARCRLTIYRSVTAVIKGVQVTLFLIVRPVRRHP
jgi:hypothetical protein